MKRPPGHLGLRHVALNVREMAASERFYVDLLGMAVVWRPDSDNLYLSSGQDNLALHKTHTGERDKAGQRLDHIGLFLATAEAVDQWYEFLTAQGVSMRDAPRAHRDGARSFYCYDPEGTLVQLIYYPPAVQSKIA